MKRIYNTLSIEVLALVQDIVTSSSSNEFNESYDNVFDFDWD